MSTDTSPETLHNKVIGLQMNSSDSDEVKVRIAKAKKRKFGQEYDGNASQVNGKEKNSI